MKNSKTTAILLVVVIFGLGLFFYFAPFIIPGNFLEKSNQKSNIEQLPLNQIPPKIPQDIVLSKNAEVLNSYTDRISGGREQSTYIYSVEIPMIFLLNSYLQYLSEKKWVVDFKQSKLGEKALAENRFSLSATKENQSLSISLFKKATSTTIITINLLE